MLNIPPHLQADFDALSPAQQAKFTQLVTMGAAGSPGNLIITQTSFEYALKSVKLMGDAPDTPAEPDKSVNHDWPFDPKQNKGK